MANNQTIGNTKVGEIVNLPSGLGSRDDQVRVVSHDPANGKTTIQVVRSGDTGDLITERDGIKMTMNSSTSVRQSESSSSLTQSGNSEKTESSGGFGVSRGDSMAHSSYESAKASGDYTGSRSSWNSYKSASEANKK